MEYQYKVVAFEATVTTKDLREGRAGSKVSAQLEIALQEYAREGWEMQGQYQFSVTVKAGCVEKLLGTKDETIYIYQLVFKKPM
jgi:hypothetical protein